MEKASIGYRHAIRTFDRPPRIRLRHSCDDSLETRLMIDGENSRGSCGLLNPCVDLLAHLLKIDRLGQQSRRAPLDRLPARFGVAIGRDHDDRNIGPRRAHHRQQIEPAHAGHIDIGEDQDQLRILDGGRARESLVRRQSKLHLEALGPEVTSKLLTKKRFDIRLVIDHKNVDAQFRPPH